MSTAILEPTCQPMAAEQYHADHSAWSKGMLMDFRERREVCHARHILGTAPLEKSSRAMDIGDVAHVALLEPHKLSTHYVTFPRDLLAKNGAVSTNEAKAFKADNESAGRVVLKESEFAIVQRMVDSVSPHIARWMKMSAKIEHAIHWTDELTDLRCKCRPDFLVVSNGMAVVLDIKTTGDASPQHFKRRVEDGGYWLQDAHYSAGVRAMYGIDPIFLFVAVETEWPHQCGVYELSAYDKATSKEVRHQTLCDVATCYETGDWSDDWTRRITQLNLKKYVYEG